jgi:hypothetical protein
MSLSRSHLPVVTSRQLTNKRRINGNWKHDLYDGDAEDNRGQASKRSRGVVDPKLVVDNLHFNVTEEDVKVCP